MTPRLESLSRAAAFVHACAAEDAAVRVQLQALFGLWMAEQAGVPEAAALVGDAAGRTRDAVETVSGGRAFEPYEHDAKLLLLCHTAMLAHDVSCPPLAHFQDELAVVLAGMEVVPRALTGEALLLQAMGAAEVGIIDAALPPAGDDLLRAEATDVRRICNEIASASLFGARPPITSETAGYARPLSVLMLQKLRDHDLVLGASLLRALKYLGAPAEEDVEYATDFLLSQQQQDGRFGHYAREVSKGLALTDPDRDLYLPVTVTVLWSLAEAWIPRFSVTQGLDVRHRQATSESQP